MKLKFSDNYNLFVIYLILNLSGYDDENNKKGMHPIRKKIRKNFLKYKKRYKELFGTMKGILKKIHSHNVVQIFLIKREGVRIIKKNYYRGFLKDLKRVEENLLAIKKFEKETNLKNFYQKQYLSHLKTIIESKKAQNRLKKSQKDIVDFVEAKIRWKISVVLNLLEAYWRGNCFFLSKGNALVVSGPDTKKINRYISWHNIAHETLHILIRYYIKKISEKRWNEIKDFIKKKVLDKDYKGGPSRFQLEETFVRAFTPLIMNENNPGYWNYLKNRFPLSEPIYKELKQKLVKGKVKFNRKIFEEILKKIEEL
jgi:hypothetical protein